MAYTNSPMVAYTKLNPNNSGQRTHSIDRITPHCVVGQCTAEGLGDWFAKSSTQASSNYGVDKDGRVGLYVEEKDRSWCSSSSANDQRAVTIECASDTSEPYAFRDAVYQTLIKLCADVCQRNEKRKLLWLEDKDKTLAYEPAADEMVLTVHRWFANKSCPGNWMYARMGDLAAKVTAALGGSTAEQKPEQPSKAACDASKVIAVAVAELGYKEKASNAQLDDKAANAGSGNYTKYARDIDEKWPSWYNGKKNGFEWCDMFVDWCFLTAYGYENALRLLCQPEKSCGAGCTYSLRYYKNKGQFHTSGPKPGDQIFFGSSLDNSTHTGLVESVDTKQVQTIEGNSSDQVIRRSYALTNDRILGYGRPAYDAVTETAPAGNPTVPAADGEKTVWDALFAFIGNPYGVAGLMGNLYAESALKPNNLQNAGNNALGMTDEQFTAAMDSGAYDNFVKDGYGYGLAQWTYPTRKAALLAYARDSGASIGDLAMQLGFLCKELEGYSAVLTALKNAASVREASDIVLKKYEAPADQSTAVQEKRAAYGQAYYDKYATADTAPAEKLTSGYYRIRQTWEDSKTQKGAYRILENAKKCADENPGYSVFDPNGNAVYPAASAPAQTAPAADTPFLVKVSITNLNIRTGPGLEYERTGQFTGAGVFTITQVSGDWGKLKSGAGWISLAYCTRI